MRRSPAFLARSGPDTAPQRAKNRAKNRGKTFTGVVALAVGALVFATMLGAAGAAPREAARHGSYCQAALAVAQYQGHDRARLDALIGRALARSRGARGSVSSLRVMRTSSPASVRFAIARQAFTQFNTDHCCECHPSSEPPQMM